MLVIFEICHFLVIPGLFEYFSENGSSQKIKVFSMKDDCYPLIGLDLGGEAPRLNHGSICFPIQNTYGGATGHQKSSTTFLTLLRRIKAHLLLMFCIKNLSIGIS